MNQTEHGLVWGAGEPGFMVLGCNATTVSYEFVSGRDGHVLYRHTGAPRADASFAVRTHH